MKELLQKLHDAAMQAILETEDVDSLESLRVKYLGKKGELTSILRQMGRLSAEERPAMGQLANQLRAEIEQTLETRRAALNEARLEMKLLQETVDVTLPGKKQPQGHKHPMYNVLDQIKDIFIGMGFEIVDGPEVELSDYNFTKLNIDEGHPSREWTDTFYFTDDSRICLRTQTSPMQIHAMETRPLPIRMIAPGRVYRKDEVDATHSPMFHQIEGMVIDRGVTMSDLKATLNLVVEKIYGKGTVTRFRPHHFPFTEPSCELDIQCHKCGGRGCPTCKGEGWIEVLGHLDLGAGDRHGLGKAAVVHLRQGEVNKLAEPFSGKIHAGTSLKLLQEPHVVLEDETQVRDLVLAHGQTLKVGDYLEEEAGVELLRSVWAEGCAVCRAVTGFDLWPELQEELPRLKSGFATYYPSMAQDVLIHHRQTEILLLNGAISRYGAACGIPTPLNDALTRMILCIQSSYEKQYRDEPKSH